MDQMGTTFTFYFLSSPPVSALNKGHVPHQIQLTGMSMGDNGTKAAKSHNQQCQRIAGGVTDVKSSQRSQPDLLLLSVYNNEDDVLRSFREIPRKVCRYGYDIMVGSFFNV
jgi:hypothetical protein